MDKYPLHTLVFFVDDIEASAAAFATLFSAKVEMKAHFRMITLNGLALGFHPSDERSMAGTTVPYFLTEDLPLAITNAQSAGFALHRGPIEVDGERIAQLRNDQDVRIGYVQKL